jgi:hypothetical protein
VHTFTYHAWATDYTVGITATKASDENVIAIRLGNYMESIDYIRDEVQLFLSHEQLLRLEVVIRDAIDQHVKGSADVCENELITQGL